jgi:hypothetical protein
MAESTTAESAVRAGRSDQWADATECCRRNHGGMSPPLDAAPSQPSAHSVGAGPRVERLLGAVAWGLAFGVLLGCWCRVFASSSSINGVLADLAAPWVAAAFLSGVMVARRPGESERRVSRPISAAIAGAIAGTVCLVVATIVYYGPARTGGFDFDGAVLRTAFWIVAGTVAGVVFGAAGAVWRSASSPRLRAVSVVGFGAIVAGEAGFLALAGAAKYDALAIAVARTLRDAL